MIFFDLRDKKKKKEDKRQALTHEVQQKETDINPVRMVNNLLVLCCMLCCIMEPPLPSVAPAPYLSVVIVLLLCSEVVYSFYKYTSSTCSGSITVNNNIVVSIYLQCTGSSMCE